MGVEVFCELVVKFDCFGKIVFCIDVDEGEWDFSGCECFLCEVYYDDGVFVIRE